MKEQTAAVQRMQDYIETHLEADITLAQLSAVSLFSPWHSYRLFKEVWSRKLIAQIGNPGKIWEYPEKEQSSRGYT